jgi:hypothetical protein
MTSACRAATARPTTASARQPIFSSRRVPVCVYYKTCNKRANPKRSECEQLVLACVMSNLGVLRRMNGASGVLICDIKVRFRQSTSDRIIRRDYRCMFMRMKTTTKTTAIRVCELAHRGLHTFTADCHIPGKTARINKIKLIRV